MKLLRYDTHRIRTFVREGDFIKFEGFSDFLKPIADLMFANSNSLYITKKQMKDCRELASVKGRDELEISFNKDLNIVFKSGGNAVFRTMDEDKAAEWQNRFQGLCGAFSMANYLNKSHKGREVLEEFLSELDIKPSGKILKIKYMDKFYFAPFEFLDLYFYIEMPALKNAESTKELKQISIYYDPELHTAESESMHFVELIKLRNYKLNTKNPELLLVSTHSRIENGISRLDNEELEKRIKLLKPKLVIFNSCVIAQNPEGIVQYFLDMGCTVLASPFYTLCSKTIFSPIFRFLDGDILTTFFLVKIFYPKIYKYFRIYIPYKNGRAE